MDPNNLRHLDYAELHDGRLRPYQADGVTFMVTTPRTLCADPPGAGKTVMAAGLIAHLAEAGVITHTHPAVVLTHRAQLAVQTAAELSRFLTGLQVVGLGDHPAMGAGSSEHQRDTALNQPAHVKVLTYDQWRTRGNLWSRRAPSVVILDEASALKGAKATYDAVMDLLHGCPLARVHLFTATPYENDPVELYRLYQLLGWQVPLPGWDTFSSAYVQWAHYRGGKRSPKGWASPEAATRFLDLAAPFTLRRDAAQLDLPRPRLTRRQTWASLTPEQTRAMAEASTLDGLKRHHARERVIVGQAAGPSVRARIAVEVIEELTADNPTAKVLVIAERLDELDAMAAGLTARGINYAMLRGDTSDRPSVVEDFRKDPDARVLLGSVVVEFGMNLQFCGHLISVGLPDTWARVEQREGRIVRTGSPFEEVEHHIVLADCPYDYAATERVHRKQAHAAAVTLAAAPAA